MMFSIVNEIVAIGFDIDFFFFLFSYIDIACIEFLSIKN